MLVAFWSPFQGLGAVSSDVLATVLATTISHKRSCSLMQLAYEDNGLFEYFMPTQDSNVGISIFENTGIDALLRNTRGKTASPDEVIDSSFSFVEKKLNVFTPTRMSTEAIYVDGLLESFNNVAHSINDVFPLNFVDVPAGMSVYAKMIIPIADVVVVCLPQTKWAIEAYLKKYKIEGPKVLHVISEYDEKQSLNLFNLSFKYRHEFNGGLIGIPHCSDYANACSLGKAVGFYLENANCTKQDVNYSFILSTKRIASEILKLCGIRGNE